MAKRKSSFWSPPAVVGRAMWGRGGFKGAMRRVRREWVGPRQVARIRIDPDTGALKKAGVRQKRNGTWEVKPSRTRRKVTAKQRIADMQDRAATASDQHAAYLKAQPKPMTQRVQRTADGKYNGSTTATTAVDPAEVAYLRALRAAERAEARANKLLGY